MPLTESRFKLDCTSQHMYRVANHIHITVAADTSWASCMTACRQSHICQTTEVRISISASSSSTAMWRHTCNSYLRFSSDRQHSPQNKPPNINRNAWWQKAMWKMPSKKTCHSERSLATGPGKLHNWAQILAVAYNIQGTQADDTGECQVTNHAQHAPKESVNVTCQYEATKRSIVRIC